MASVLTEDELIYLKETFRFSEKEMKLITDLFQGHFFYRDVAKRSHVSNGAIRYRLVGISGKLKLGDAHKDSIILEIVRIVRERAGEIRREAQGE